MIKEPKNIFYCIRIDSVLYTAIHNGALQEQIKPSKYVRQILVDKIGQIGQPCDNQFSADNVKIA
jgi:hypothetical protein